MVCCATSVSAGFVLQGSSTPLSRLDFNAAQSSTTSTTPVEAPPTPLPSVIRQHLDGIANSGSMTGSSVLSGATGSLAPVAVLEVGVAAGGSGLLTYLLVEPYLPIPVPFLDGVFRPPRG